MSCTGELRRGTLDLKLLPPVGLILTVLITSEIKFVPRIFTTMSKDDPFISYAQRQTLYHMTGDRYWIEHEDITSEAAGKQFALVRGKKKVAKSNDPLRESINKRQLALNLHEADILAKELAKPEYIKWDTLDFKDKSAVLQEQGLDIKEGKYITSSGRCQQFMYDLRDMLKQDIQGEIKSNADYQGREAFLLGVELPIWASAVGHIAHEEAQHKAILEIMVDVITEKCGTGEILSDAEKAQIKWGKQQK